MIAQYFKKSQISRREYLFLIIYFCFITGLVLIPSIYGSLTTPSDKQFMHNAFFPRYAQDINAYLSWIKQVQEGNFLLKIKYTSEEHSPIFLNPLFLTAGLISFKLSLVQTIYLLQILANSFFLLSLYLFISYFIRDKTQRIFVLILSTLAGGFGWIFHNENNIYNYFYTPIDLWMPEATIFQSLRWPFIFAFSISLMLWSFILILKSWKEDKLRYAFAAGISGFILAFVHPYNLTTVFFVIASYFFLSFPELKGKWKNLLIFFSLSSIPLLYHFHTLQTSYVFNEVFGNFGMYTPYPLSVLGGLGLILVLAIIGLITLIITRKNEKYFLLAIVWIFSVAILIYCPLINFQRRLIMGIYIPLAMFASSFLVFYWQRIKTSQSIYQKLVGISSLVAIISFSSLGQFFILKNDLKLISEKSPPFYLETEVIQGIKWLGENSFPEEIVLSSPITGQFIPVISGNTVFVGHTDLNTNYYKKYQEAEWFFGGSKGNKEELSQFLETNRINYIFVSPYEKKDWKSDDFQFRNSFDDFLAKIYQNRLVTIYQFPHLPS